MDSDRRVTKIFVSYRRDDSAYVAAAINEKLEERFGADSVFFDIDSIPLGADFRQHISDAVGECDILLAIIGDSWVEAVDEHGNYRLNDPADFVRLELESALLRDIPVIPVLVDEASIPSKAVLPPSLQNLAFRNAAEVRAGRDLQQHLARLVKGVERVSQSVRAREEQPAGESLQTSSSESSVGRPRSAAAEETQDPLDKQRLGAQLAEERLVFKEILGHPLVVWPGAVSGLALFYIGLLGSDTISFAVTIGGLLVSAVVLVFKYSKHIVHRRRLQRLDLKAREHSEVASSSSNVVSGAAEHDLPDTALRRHNRILAEDLAFRELETTWWGGIARHVDLGHGHSVDGFFQDDAGRTRVFEVKYADVENLEQTVQRAVMQIRRMAEDVTLDTVTLAVVTSGAQADIEQVLERVQEQVSLAPFEIDLRVYSLENLKEKFGVSASRPNKSIKAGRHFAGR